jgi:hypothetical protein
LSVFGGVDSYYRQFLSEPDVAEAICRWDAGVRVANIADFERVNVPGIDQREYSH